MSMPTFYIVKNKNNKVLGEMMTDYFSWHPISRERQREAFDAEVGGLIVRLLAPYCSGQQESVPNPKYTLADVGSIESNGGKVLAHELKSCVLAYISSQEDFLENIKEKDNNDPSKERMMTHYQSRIEKAHEVVQMFDKIEIDKAKTEKLNNQKSKPRKTRRPTAKPRNP